MQLSRTFSSLSLFVLALASAGMTTPLAPTTNETATVAADEAPSYLVSQEQMMHWLATTDAELTFVGAPPNPLALRSAQDTTVVYCSTRVDSICGGVCTMYNGGSTCLAAPNTNCLSATNNVGFCDRSGCGHSCNQLSTCGTRLDNGFCFTPGTQSILVSTA